MIFYLIIHLFLALKNKQRKKSVILEGQMLATNNLTKWYYPQKSYSVGSIQGRKQG